jgi:alkylation response protein AidB-like acyl-CoA dehydrogenase
VANAPLADWLAVFADAGGRQLVALVHREQEGLRLGERLALVGLDGLATCAVELDGVRVPPACALGPFDAPEPERWCRRSRDLGLATAGVGRMHVSFATAKAHAETRRRGGKPLVARQEISFKLAELLTATQTAELLVCRAAWMMNAGDPEAGTLVRCAKVFCAENAERVASGAMQILAGSGCIAGNAAERAWREARTLAVLGTTVEVSRMAIADELLARA